MSHVAENESHSKPRSDKAESAEILTHVTPTYWLCRESSRLAYTLFFRPKISGREHLPAEGPVVLVSNHQSFLDIPLISFAATRHVSFVARQSLAKSALLRRIMKGCGAVLVQPESADRGALRDMNAHLAAGDCLGLFPEGTRSQDGSVGEFRAGALMVAKRNRAPLVPIAIRGGLQAWPRKSSFPKPARLWLRFGAPIDSSVPDALEKARDAVVEMVGDGRFPSS